MAIKISQGGLVPDKAALKRVLSHLKTDKKSLAAYKKSPNQYLADIGLNVDVRREILLNEPNGKRFAAKNKKCWWTCVFTACPCTNCCITITI
jgi:hypothetical protein